VDDVVTTPSASLTALASRILVRAEMLIDDPGHKGKDWELQRLVRNFLMWSITVERMATSGPKSQAEVERGFRGHAQAGHVADDRLATHRAHLDVIAFLTVGDMVLDDLAAVILKRWKLTAGSNPWLTFTRTVDERVKNGTAGPEQAPTRYLDVLLRTARDRVVAHWRQGHTLNFGWQMDGSLHIDLIDPRGQGKALDILRRVNASLPLPSRDTSFDDLRDWAIAMAPEMDASQRDQLAEAFKHAGYGLFPPDRIVGDVLQLVDLIAPVSTDQRA
jgi:hypothetical protein